MNHPRTRIAIVRTLGSPIDRQFYNSQELGLGAALTEHDLDIDVFVAGTLPAVNASAIQTEGPGNLRLIQVPFKKLPLIGQALMPQLRKHLAKTHYDFVQVNESNEIESWLTARLAHRMGTPVALYQGMYVDISGRIQAAFQWIYNSFCLPSLRRHVNFPLAKTNRARKFLEARGFETPVVLPVGIDPSPFQAEEPTAWRNQLSIPPNHQVLLYVGNLEPRRRPDLIIELATAMVNDEISFVIAGKGVDEHSIRSLIQSRDLDNVHLLGQISQSKLPSLYRESDVLLLPSTYEIYGMVVLEAMYFGLPVISSKTAGPESLIQHGKDGWIIDGLEFERWNDTIRKVLNDTGKLNACSEAARKKIAAELTWNVIAQQYNQMVRSAC